jgi:hydroxymethylpyrimidine pyrophosphatase-like HAD family hydrolase
MTSAAVLPRLVATDLDGTLLRGDGTVSPRTRRALDAIQAAGAEVVICTARPVRWMRGLASDAGIAGTAVCANGAVLWDLPGDALVDSFPVAHDCAREVVARLASIVPGGAWAVEGVDSFGHEPGYERRWPVPDDTVVDDLDILLATPPVKLLLRRPTGSAADPAQARDAVADLVELTWSEPSAQLLEMSAAGVSKGSGLALLCAARGVDAADVVAFGDMPNDLEMLAWAGHGVAMGNADPSVAATADEVTLTHQQDGVAAVLERLLGEAR